MLKSHLKFLLLMAVALMAISQAFADTIHLKSGDSFDGEIVSETEDAVLFEIEGGTIEFKHSEIEELERTGKKRKKKQSTSSVVESTKKKEGFLDGIKKKWSEITSGDKKTKRKKSEDGFFSNIWIFMGLHSVLAFFLVGLTMKLYFALFGESLSYWLMLWFQIKAFLIGLLVACVIGFCFGAARALFAGEGSQASPWGAVLSSIGYVIVFYRVAKKDLDSGIFKTFGMSWVMALTNLALWKVMEAVGFSVKIPSSWMQYIN